MSPPKAKKPGDFTITGHFNFAQTGHYCFALTFFIESLEKKLFLSKLSARARHNYCFLLFRWLR